MIINSHSQRPGGKRMKTRQAAAATKYWLSLTRGQAAGETKLLDFTSFTFFTFQAAAGRSLISN